MASGSGGGGGGGGIGLLLFGVGIPLAIWVAWDAIGWWLVVWAVVLPVGGWMLWALWMERNHAPKGDVEVERGARVVSASAAEQALWGVGEEDRPAGANQLGGVTVPPDVETRHLLLSGTTGSGKTQALHRVVSAVQARGGRMMVADSGGEFLSRYWREGEDVILNPFDGRGRAWTPFCELEAPYDAARIAASIVPEGSGNSAEWNHYARTLLAGALGALHREGTHSMRELLHILTAAGPEELSVLLEGTPAAILATESNDRMLASTRGVLATYVDAWQYLPDVGDFSVREWVRDEDAGWLFAPYRDDQLSLLRSSIAAWIDVAAVEALTLGESADRDLWLVLDEMDSLGRVSSLDQALSKARKYGLRIAAGCQTIAQVRGTYGKETSQTIMANCGNKVILRAGDGETAEYFSKEIGEQDIARKSESYSRSQQDGDDGGSTTTSVQHSRQAAVMAAELQALPDLSGYLSLASYAPAVKIELDVLNVPQIAPAFVTGAPQAGPARRQPQLSVVDASKTGTDEAV